MSMERTRRWLPAVTQVLMGLAVWAPIVGMPSTASAQTTFEPGHPQYEPPPVGVGGQWEGPYLLEQQVNPTADTWSEFAHIAMLPPPNQGRVLFWNPRKDFGPYPMTSPAGDRPQESFLWEPNEPNQLTVISVSNSPLGDEEIFCGGHTFTEDGQLIVFGGTNALNFILNTGSQGTAEVFLFDNELYDPAVPGAMPSWRRLTPMERPRFYPSVARRADATMVVGGHTGKDVGFAPSFPQGSVSPPTNLTREFAVPSGVGAALALDWGNGPGMPAPISPVNYIETPCATTTATYDLHDYPRWHVLGGNIASAGKIMRTTTFESFLEFDVCPATGTGEKDRFVERDQMDPLQQPTATQMNSVHLLFHDGNQLENNYDEVIYALGGSIFELCSAAISSRVSRILNPGSGDVTTDKWVSDGSFDMTFSRLESNTVILLDGSLLVVGGYGLNAGEQFCDPRLLPERYEPPEIFGDSAATWTNMTHHQHPRRYHSVAGLLPDGRVVSAGGQRPGVDPPPDPQAPEDPDPWYSVEVFRPPYFFSPNRRPQIHSVTQPNPKVEYGDQITISATLFTGTQSIQSTPPGQFRVALLAPCTATHATDFNQRYIQLKVDLVSQSDPRDPALIQVTAPPNGNVAPPGPYMLTVVNEHGLPSVARWINIAAQ